MCIKCNLYFASTSDKRGRKRQHAFGQTRNAAARAVFDLDTKAQACTTEIAHINDSGRVVTSGNGMQWINRRDLPA